MLCSSVTRSLDAVATSSRHQSRLF